jgi:hypothetical protein
MTTAYKKWMGVAPLFDPAQGVTVIEPPGNESGWWAGAGSAIYDEDTSRFFLYYRIRKPRPLRGAECRIAESTDGVNFRDIWSAQREDFNSPSVERSALVKTLEGGWRLFISFVDPADQKWRIDMMEADTPDGFRPAARVKVLTADDVGVEGVKDPYVVLLGRRYYMLISYAPSPEKVSARQRAEMHATADVYNTGVTKSHTALALSNDGLHFEWQGDVFTPPQEGWDAYAGRLGCVLYIPPVFNVFYDGGAKVSENYEEKTGLAISLDLTHYQRITGKTPLLVSPHGSGSLRYMDVIKFDDVLYYYYEYARADGSHELRMNKVSY